MADVIGRAVIEVAPDVTRFARQLSRDLRQVTRNFKKISVGVSVGSIRKAFVEVSKLNTALRATVLGFTAIGAKVVVAGLLSAANAAAELSGALLLVPALGAAAAAAMGTLAVGLFGVDDAMKAFLKGDADKFNEALKELSPNAQKALSVLKEFQPELKKFRDAVQDALFAGLETSFKDLGTKLLPEVKRGFVGIAGEFNLMAKGLANFATSGESVSAVNDILDDIRRTFHALIPATTAFGQIIRDTVREGARFLPGIAAQLSVAAQGFAAFVNRSIQSGAFQEFLVKGVVAVERLIGVIADLGGGLRAVLQAADDAGFGVLDTITKVAAKFEEFTKSLEGQGALRRFFANAKAGVDALAPVLGALLKFFNDQFFPIVVKIATILGPSLVVFINAIGRAFDAARPGIEAFARGVGSFLEAIAPALPAIGRLASAFGTLLGTVLERLGPVIERLIVVVSDALTTALSDPALVDGIVALVTGFAQFAEAIAPALPAIAKLAGAIGTTLGTVLAAIGPELERLIELLAKALTDIVSDPELVRGIIDLALAFGDVLAAIIPLLPPLVKLITAILPFLIALVRALVPLFEHLKPILEALGPIIILVAFALETLAKALTATLNPMGAFTARSEAGSNGMSIFSNAIAAAINPLGFFQATITEAMNKSGDVVTGFVQGARHNLVDELPGTALNPAGTAIEGFENELKRIFGVAVVDVSTAMDEIGSAITGEIAPAGQAGTAIGIGFTGGIRGGLLAAKDAAFGGMNAVKAELNNRGNVFGSGSAIGDELAAGIIAKIAKVRQAAQELMRAAAAPMPRSPAKIGPFSGRGWTPFRGRALVEGFAKGLDDGLGTLREASSRVANTAAFGVSTSLPSTRGLPQQPPVTVNPRFSASTGPIDVRVMIDGRELTGVVVKVVDERDRERRREVLSGRGGGQ